MGFSIATLWRSPEINPINRKARTIPFLNPITNTYGRTFFFSWFGFMIAFWSWYAFPPLLSDIIAKDIHMTPHQVANSNVIALTATLLVRLVAGPSCDRFGPRYTFAGCLLAGAVPTFLAGCVHNTAGLYALRFFIGILGGAFVPCQVWTTGFFDKNVVGTANAITGGLGNLGGGITYFVMPAVYYALVKDGMKPHKAWRVSFIVPGILIVFVALCLIFLCDDTPMGKWSDRTKGLPTGSTDRGVVAAGGNIMDAPRASPSVSISKDSGNEKHGAGEEWKRDNEAQDVILDSAAGEVIQKPTFTQILKVCFSLQTLVTGACYFCTFGAELSINSILGTYYRTNFPHLTVQKAGDWAAMFGMLNGVCRPLGGMISDLAYKYSGNNVWAKKVVLHTYGIMTGVFLIAIGVLNSKHEATMFGLIAGMAFFLEGGNGADYGLVPHVHPQSNGVVSGFTGACGNLGGIIFAIIFRYNGKHYGKVFWIIGTIVIAINLSVSWIRPVAKRQMH